MKPNWLIWGYLPGTAAVMWYLAGRETRTPLYYLYAGCYVLFYLISFAVIALAGYFENEPLAFLGVVFVFLIWIGSYRHTVRDRYEIWLRLKYSAASYKKKQVLSLEDRIELEYGFIPKNLIPPPPPPSGASPREQALMSEIAALMNQQSLSPHSIASSLISVPNRKIDPNTADRQSLADLPNIGTAIALEIVRVREQHGLFSSFDDFCERCTIKPHHRITLEEFIEIRPITPPPERNNKSKRKTRRID